MSNENSLNKSQTHDESISEENKVQIHEAVLEEFECPICAEYMVPPIKSCVAGHNFCYRCDRKILMCPICRGEKEKGRNLGMESIFVKLVVPCKNDTRGCTMEVFGGNLREHQQFCQYRLFTCPLRVVNNCRKKGQLKDLVEHCQENHIGNVFCTSTMQLLWPRFRYTTVLRTNQPGDTYVVICQAYGELFKGVWEMDINTGFMKWCVVYMGSISNIHRYSFEVLFQSKNPFCKEKPIRMRSCCQPDNQVLFQKDKYILTHVDEVRKFCGLRGLYYTVTILEDGKIPATAAGHSQFTSYFSSPNPSNFMDLNDPSLVEVTQLFRRLNLGNDIDWIDDSF